MLWNEAFASKTYISGCCTNHATLHYEQINIPRACTVRAFIRRESECYHNLQIPANNLKHVTLNQYWINVRNVETMLVKRSLVYLDIFSSSKAITQAIILLRYSGISPFCEQYSPLTTTQPIFTTSKTVCHNQTFCTGANDGSHQSRAISIKKSSSGNKHQKYSLRHALGLTLLSATLNNKLPSATSCQILEWWRISSANELFITGCGHCEYQSVRMPENFSLAKDMD